MGFPSIRDCIHDTFHLDFQTNRVSIPHTDMRRFEKRAKYIFNAMFSTTKKFKKKFGGTICKRFIYELGINDPIQKNNHLQYCIAISIAFLWFGIVVITAADADVFLFANNIH